MLVELHDHFHHANGSPAAVQVLQMRNPFGPHRSRE